MRQYLSFFKLKFAVGLQYKAAALAGLATQIFFGLVFIMVYMAFYGSGDANVDISLSEIIPYQWLSQAFLSLIWIWHKDNEILNMIKNGNVAYELCRPQNLYWMWYIRILASKLSAVLLRCVPLLIIAFLLPYPYNLSLPSSFGNFIIFIISLILACLLITSLSLIVHIITLFTIESRGVITTYSTIAEVFMGTVIPIPFFPDWLANIAKHLPFRYIGDFPYRIYSNSITISDGIVLLSKSFIWIIITILIGIVVSKFALKKAVIQGG